MLKERTIETKNGLQSADEVLYYDNMMRISRDKGYLYTKEIMKFGIIAGSALEIGPGPGYLGLEWVKNTKDTFLTGLEISPNMIRAAEKNASIYGLLEERVKYVLGNSESLPFDNSSFEAVFSNAVLHEIEDPAKAFNEIFRVLKPGGLYFISDLRRDMNSIVKYYMKSLVKPKIFVSGLIASINASYTENEIRSILQNTFLTDYKIEKNPFSIFIKGKKQ